MPQSKYELAVEHLYSSNYHDCLLALRFIKNSVIGNKSKKDSYIRLGVIPRLVEVLNNETEEEDLQLKTQAAIVLGSFAFGNDDNILALINSGAMQPLFTCLTLPQYDAFGTGATQKLKLVEAAARAIKAIYTSSRSPKTDLFTQPNLLNLIHLLEKASLALEQNSYGTSSIAVLITELAASIIARCCESPERQQEINELGAIPPLVTLIGCSYAKPREAALDALAALCKDNAELGNIIVSPESGDDTAMVMIKLVRDKTPSTRLMAATCLVNLNRTNVIPNLSRDITLIVLPTLVKLLDSENYDCTASTVDSFMDYNPVKERVPLVLADLVKDSEAMQKAACDAGAIPRLGDILKSLEDEGHQTGEIGSRMMGYMDRLKENTLTAIAAITLTKEECRKQAIDSKILSHVVLALSHPQKSVRIAACQAAKSLSRSVKILRTSLVDAGILTPLFKLLSDESISVQTAACAALCNIVLEFSPSKKAAIENGCVERFVAFAHSKDTNLRLNSMWALKNLCYKADNETKHAVMGQLTYGYLAELCNDPDIGIQEQTLDFIRNYIYGTGTNVEEMFKGLGRDGEQLMDIVEAKLTNEYQKQIIEPALYITVNITVGNERHKMAIMNRDAILNAILQYMDHEDSSIRVAAVWCVINLTYMETTDTNLKERLQQLRARGFEDKLKRMLNDPEVDVKDRVRSALSQFSTEQRNGSMLTT